MPRQIQRRREEIRQIDNAVRFTRLDHAFPVNEGWHTNAAFPCRTFRTAERRATVRRNFGFRTVIRGEHNQRVIKLTVFLQCFIQIGEDIVHLHHAVAVRGARRRATRIFGVRVVIEVTAASAVIEEERLITLRHLVEELNAIFHPALIQVFHIFRRNVGNGFLFTTAHGMNVIFAERQFLDVFRTSRAQGDFRVDMNITPFGIHIGHRVKAAEIIKANVLRLRLFVFPHMPFPDSLGDVALIVQQLRQRG